jgi:hypothetical protein
VRFARKDEEERTVLSVAALRALGTDGLTDFLRARPEVLLPSPPRSLEELQARLHDPEVLASAARRWNMPTLQVCVVLATLGERADHEQLHRLLGIGSDDQARRAACEQALAVLRDDHVLRPSGPRLVPEVAELWRGALGLDDDLETFASTCTADDLRAVLRTHGQQAPSRKADLVARVVALLSDADRVRAICSQAPARLADTLRQVAAGRITIEYYGSWYSLRCAAPDQPLRDPVEWALARFLLVRRPWTHELAMPAQVALALRGPNWHAPFDPDPPPLTWSVPAPETVASAAAASASIALRTMTAVLAEAGSRPIPRLKSGAVGVRELRRLAAAVDTSTSHLRLTLALSHHLGLLAAPIDAYAPTGGFDEWEMLPTDQRYGHLLYAWLTLPSSPTAADEAAWQPEVDDHEILARRTALDLLAARPGAAPASPATLTQAAHWRAPLALGPSLEAATSKVLAILTEAAWLGVTGAGTLSPAGAAALCALPGGDVMPAVARTMAGRLGEARTVARFQTDLTAVVLGEPGPRLAATLDLAADRETRSAASVWRFSLKSVRQALDSGIGAEEVLSSLVDVAEGDLPQPLVYLIRDVERRHGLLRSGAVTCYLRSQDEPLLSEIVADRRLRKLGLQRVAPTVVVGRRPLAETLEALRAAGHAPVQEGQDGATIATRRPHHRAEPAPHRSTGPSPSAGRSQLPAGPPARFTPEEPVDPAHVAAALLATPDRPARASRGVGANVIDLFHPDTSDDHESG